jgi:hypothetical protein
MLSSAEVQSACSRTDYRSIRMMYVKISTGVARNGFAPYSIAVDLLMAGVIFDVIRTFIGVE